MVAYNFQARFAPDVEKGRKLQTIRANGKRRQARAGELLQLYTGMRQPACRLLGLAYCTATWQIQLTFHPQPNVKMILLGTDGGWMSGVAVKFARAHLDEFAKDDGFRNWDELAAWFGETHGPARFEGTLIRWKLDDARATEKA